VEQLITHLVQNGSLFYGIIGAMIYGLFSTIDAYK
jgi:hypothetical protein